MAQTAEIIQFGARRKRVKGKSDAIDGGWVKSYRKRLEEEFSLCPIKYVVWDFLLLNATHKPHETRLGAKPVTLMPGQLITSKPKILKQFSKSVIKVTIDHIRGALDLFIKEGMITAEGSRKGTIITIVNWTKYQGENTPENTNFAPRQIPDTNPRHETGQEASEYEALGEVVPDSFPDTNPDSFPAIQEDNNILSSINTLVTTDVETTDKKASSNSQFSYPEEFEWIWKNRPRREGSDDKRKALSCCKARIKSGATWRQLAEGMKRYKAYCEKREQIHTQYTMQMTKFFGTGEHYENDWAVKADQPTGSSPTESTKSSSRKAVTAAVMDIRDTDW